MRIAVAQVIQETCSFTPTQTTMARFHDSGLREGQDVIDGVGGTSALAGFLDAVAGQGTAHSIVPLLDATAVAGGPLTAETLDELETRLITRLRETLPVDALYLSLHGASVAALARAHASELDFPRWIAHLAERGVVEGADGGL